MSAETNAIKLGKENQNLVLETAGRIWVKVQDRFYELDFRNKGKTNNTNVTNIIHNNASEEVEAPDMNKYVTKNLLKSTLNEYVTKRNWKDVVQTTGMLQQSLLDGFTESISPITINTMQVVVGSEQLQYDFIKGFENNQWDESVISGGSISENNDVVLTTYHVKLKGGWIKHYTIDGPNTVRAQDSVDVINNNRAEIMSQYCRWHIADNEFDLLDSPYYVYIKVPNLGMISQAVKNGYPKKAGASSYYFLPTDPTSEPPITHTEAEALRLKTNIGYIKENNHSVYPEALSDIDGEYVISQSAIEMYSESGYYYLLFAIINSADDNGSRSYTTMNGFTEITPGRITAYRFMSPDGIQYLNFLDKSMHLGDENSFIEFDADTGKFYIKGTIVQSPSGDTFPLPCYRGEFTEEQIRSTEDPNLRPVFYYGDSITFDGQVWINTYANSTGISNIIPGEVLLDDQGNPVLDGEGNQIYPWKLYSAQGADGKQGPGGKIMRGVKAWVEGGLQNGRPAVEDDGITWDSSHWDTTGGQIQDGAQQGYTWGYQGMADVVLDSNGDNVSLFYDVVYTEDNSGNKTYYYCARSSFNGDSAADSNALSNTNLWRVANNFDFIATKVLLAEHAEINLLSSNNMYVKDSNGNVVAGMQGGSNKVNLFAGYDNRHSFTQDGADGSNFQVWGNSGKVVVKGSIEADGDNFKDEDDDTIEYAIKSNNGLYVKRGRTSLNGTNVLSGNNLLLDGATIQKNWSSGGAEGGVELNVGVGGVNISVEANNQFFTNDVHINPYGILLTKKSGITTRDTNVVESEEIRYLKVVNSGSTMADEDTIYFIKEVPQANS